MTTEIDPGQEGGPAPYLQTLGRGLMALEVLTNGPISVIDLGQRMGLSRPTSYRLLKTLEQHGWVTRADGDGVFRLSMKAWEIAAAVLPEAVFQDVLQRYGRMLLEAWGETVHVAIYDRGDAVYIYKRDGTFPIRSYTQLGGRSPAHLVATGKALLSFQDTAERRRVIASIGAASDDPHRSQEVAADLDQVREAGVAFNGGEWRHDVGGIAVPILDQDGRVLAAIGLSGPIPRIFEQREDKVGDLKRVRAEIERGLV